MTYRIESQHEASVTLPRILGMDVRMITDNAERTEEHGQLRRCIDGRWQVNERVFAVSDVTYFLCEWIDHDHYCTRTLIVVDEEAPSGH